MFSGQLEYAVPMSYAFLGGVLSSITVLKFAPAILPVPLATIIVTAVIAHHLDQPSIETSAPYIAGGFVAGVILSFLGPGKNSNKKNK